MLVTQTDRQTLRRRYRRQYTSQSYVNTAADWSISG